MERNPYLARILRSAIALAIVVVAYWGYALAAVPFLEPVVIDRQTTSSTDDERNTARNIHLPYLKLFAAYFPADHWVHQNPKVLVNDSAMLLLKDYNPLPDGQVELNPCIMIFFPQARTDDFEPQRQALILETPQGAILQFADGFDLAQAKIGKLTQGQLRGEVTIRSDMSAPGEKDDLFVRTRDIRLTEDRIWTDHDVQFRVGENHGHGTQMEIRLLPSERRAGTAAMNVSGIQSMELSRNVQMNLTLGQAGLLPEEAKNRPSTVAKSSDSAEPTSAEAKPEPGPPVEITCRGPFHFDLVRHVATFEEQVDVLRLNPAGPSDQMTCEVLAIHFLPDPKKAKPKKGSPGMQPLRPTMLEARGMPVIVRSPSTGGQARCERLRYDLETRTIALDGSEEIMLFQGTNEIHAPALQYQPSEKPGGLGMVWAAGPGWLRAAADKDPNRIFQARWGQELHLRQHEGEHVISIRGRPELGMVGMGNLTANEVHVWLKETPVDPTASATPTPAEAAEAKTAADNPAAPKQKVTPDRLMADGDVQIDSPSLIAATARMEAWFKQSALAGPAQPKPDTTNSNSAQRDEPRRAANNPANNTGNGNAANNQQARDNTSPRPAGEEPLKAQYNLQGQLIRLQVLQTEQQAEVTDATVSGGVTLRETQTVKPEDKPLVITGDQLQLTKANLPESHVAVSGKPAVVLARGLTMQGALIQLARGENRLWIDGPGTMNLPARRNLRGEATPDEQTLTIDWQGKMNFDGLTVEYQKEVVGRGEGQLLRTGLLQVVLQQKVDFATAGKQTDPQLQRIICRDGVYLENHSLVEGERTSFDQMTTQDMTIDQVSGDLFANGPGSLITVRRGGEGADPLAGGGIVKPVSTPVGGAEQPAAAAEGELKYLRVDFRRAMEGNTIRREVSFGGETRAIYGPVADWGQTIDPDDPRGLGERDILMNADKLKVTEMDTMRNGRKTMELEALGNALVEGQTFTARAERMAYAQAKELLVLEGTGKTDAQLWRQTHVGAPATHAAARKIMYWKNTNRVEVNDARFFGGQFGGEKK